MNRQSNKVIAALKTKAAVKKSKSGEIMNHLMQKKLLNLCLMLSVWISMSAWAESADRDKPIELEADTVTVNDAKKTSTYMAM